MLRWGILSTAKIAVEQVIPSILMANNSIITAIASRDINKAQNIAQRFSIPVAYGDYESLLASPDVDAIYIPLPTSQHVQWSIKAAQAGKHVLCEKPIALNAQEIDEIMAAGKANNVLISEAFMVTYHPQWHKVRELIAAGSIGALKNVQSSFTYFNKDPNNMRNIPELGGGALPDIGVYPIIAARFCSGQEPISVSSIVEYDSKFGTDTFASAHLRFNSFTMAMYVSTQLSNRQEVCFHGDKGWITVAAPFNAGIYNDDVVTQHNVDHSEATYYRFPKVNQYVEQTEAFAAAILDGQIENNETIFSLEDSINNQKVIDAIYRAGKSGQWENV